MANYPLQTSRNLFICLAAGQGQRMKPLTNYLHKAMIPFSGLPFLAYSLCSIPEGSEVIIIVNYLWEQMANYFGQSYKGRKIKYLKQSDPKGTGDALFQFSKIHHPKQPVIVWQADQMIFPDEVKILSRSEPNAAIYSDTHEGLYDLGFWKIRPDTLSKLKGHFERGEYRALPVLKTEGLNSISVQREKLEISFNTWKQIELQCKLFKQKFLTESR
jgi:NDP-sugar pyrophosphorylase family protein